MKTTKNEYLQVRLTSEQKKSIRVAAEQANVDMSSWILSRLINSQSDEFISIVNKLSIHKKQSYIYAEIHDFLMNCDSINFALAVKCQLSSSLNHFQLNYVVAMVEQRAQQLGEAIPEWCFEISKLEASYFGSNLKSLKLHLLLNSPLAFRRRNIFIDSTIGMRI